MYNIGTRVKYFRNRAGISQMNLELDTDSAFGSISRLESGKVSPTRETIDHLCNALKLTDREVDYLSGPTSIPASKSEIESAKEEVSTHFHTKGVLAYLVDDRYRVWDYSDSFARFFGISRIREGQMAPKLIGRTLIEILLIPELGVRKYFEGAGFPDTLRHILTSCYHEVSFMADDPDFQRTLTVILADPDASAIWDELQKNDSTGKYMYADRRIAFKISKFEITLNFGNQYLRKHRRFVVVEYFPNNKLVQLFSKIL